MLEFCARILMFQRAPTWPLACLLLLAAAGCKQDWSAPSSSPDGGIATDAGARDSAVSRELGVSTSERNDAGVAVAQDQRKPAQAGSGDKAQAGASGASGQGDDARNDASTAGGSSGMAGADSGTAIDVSNPEPCTTPGVMRCLGAGGQREVCEDGAFRLAEACLADEVCDEEAACVQIAAICQGSAGSNVCDGQGGLVSCAANGSVKSQEGCMSERHCQVGIALGQCPQCIPDEFRCGGATLEQCEKDGQGYKTAIVCQSAALCKAESGACTDAACASGAFKCSSDVLTRCNAAQTAFEMVKTCPAGLCDATGGDCLECSPGSRSCERNTDIALVCDGSGQKLARNACVAPRSHCVGAGQCVECAVETPCPQSNQVCRTANCNLRNGSCEDTQVMAGTGCSASGRSGVCDSAGACVECLSEGDGRCAGATPHCTSAHTCVRCTADNHCGFDEKCVSASCTKKCGDGVLDEGEDCERGYLNSSASNCDFATCKRTNYINCHDTSVQCVSPTVCLAASYCLPTSDRNCVTSCPEVPGMKAGCSTGICYLDCTAAAGGKCPSDMHCEHTSPDSTSFVTDMCFGNNE